MLQITVAAVVALLVGTTEGHRGHGLHHHRHKHHGHRGHHNKVGHGHKHEVGSKHHGGRHHHMHGPSKAGVMNEHSHHFLSHKKVDKSNQQQQQQPSGPLQPTCKMTQGYPPDSSRDVAWYDIDLDAAPEQRWNAPVTALKDEIIAMYDLLYNCVGEGGEPCIGSRVLDEVAAKIAGQEKEIIARWPSDYGQELIGISNITGIPLNQLIGLNMGYEILGACTSIVAYNSQTETMYHGRNLDFGLLLGMNYSDFQWEFTDRLRDVTFNARMNKGGKVLWSGTFFASFIGLVTGNRQNSETITINSRFDDNFDKYLIKWLRDQEDTDQFITQNARYAIENYDSYDDAVKFILGTKMVSPGYVIIGGPQPRQGGVITIGPDGSVEDWWNITQAYPSDDQASDRWYVLQTNYDHWNPAPFFDDRRMPGIDCMNEVGSENLNFETLYNVLYGKPNRNRLTAYTSLMECASGKVVAYRQYCDDRDCSPW